VSKVELELPDGWERDGQPEFSEGHIHPGWYIPLRRTAPQYMAVLLPRDVVERRASGEFLHADEPAVNGAAREALARTAVVIAGPAGCAEVPLDEARAAFFHAERGNAAGAVVLQALRKAAGGS
jgi:hypothetical protein